MEGVRPAADAQGGEGPPPPQPPPRAPTKGAVMKELWDLKVKTFSYFTIHHIIANRLLTLRTILAPNMYVEQDPSIITRYHRQGVTLRISESKECCILSIPAEGPRSCKIVVATRHSLLKLVRSAMLLFFQINDVEDHIARACLFVGFQFL